MKTKPSEDVFAPMLFLDEETKRYEGGYPSKRTEAYYETLLAIREAQSKGESPDKAYAALGAPRGFGCIEYGYYYANIHYYLFKSCSEFERNDAYKVSINKRIRFFLKDNADPLELMKRGWFPLNFPGNYLSFLELFYGNHRDGSSEGLMATFTNLAALVARYGNEIEKEIVELTWPIIGEYQAWESIVG